MDFVVRIAAGYADVIWIHTSVIARANGMGSLRKVSNERRCLWQRPEKASILQGNGRANGISIHCELNGASRWRCALAGHNCVHSQGLTGGQSRGVCADDDERSAFS